MMEAASTSETSVNFYQNTRRNNLEDTPWEPEIIQVCFKLTRFEVLTNVKLSMVVFRAEDGESMLLRNVDAHLQVHMESKSRRWPRTCFKLVS
jgi:hypothetical protein